MKTQINKSELFTEAWITYKDHNGEISFSQCLKISWNLAKGIITNGISKDSDITDIKEVVYTCQNQMIFYSF